MSTNNMELILSEINLGSLPQQIENNRSLANRAITAMQERIVSLPSLEDMKELDVLMGDNIEKEVNELRVRGKEAEKINREGRMVYTRAFDDIKKGFISFEKGIVENVQILDEYSAAWNSEKLRRIRLEEERKEQEAKYNEAKIDFSAHILSQMEMHYSLVKRNFIERMNNRFYSCKNEEELESFKKDMENYTPVYPMEEYSFKKDPLLTDEDMAETKRIAEETHIPVMTESFVKEINEEKNRLIELIPARRNELKRIETDIEAAREAEERIAREKKEREEREKKEEEEREKQRIQEANLEKMNKSLENEAVAPAVELSKGTSVKLKYDVQTHQQMLLVIQWWVQKELPLMTIPDMIKRLSFMRTAASRALNKGEQISGVPIIEDVRTRRS